MFFKKKCPSCGAKNDKEREGCIECGATLALEKATRQVADVPDELLDDELLDSDSLVWATMVKDCPECGSKNTQGCKNNPLLEDNTIGHCLECGIYWCQECGYVFESVEKGTECPHWEICAECSDEQGYLDPLKFMEQICTKCELTDNGCPLEDPLQCDKRRPLLCPYESAVSKCPQIEEETSSADSTRMESEYIKHIPGKCTYCGSSDVSETLKRTIKGELADGYLWDVRCDNCGANRLTLEKPDFQ
ncbi:hypothetical protein ACFLVX_05220 [Chloroflexota bacterium]